MLTRVLRLVAFSITALVPPVSRGGVAAPEAIPSFAEPGISPDGREIAFVSGGDIWTVPSAGGEARLLVSHPATESRPLYAPDGTRLAFVSTRSGNGDIYVLTLATGALRRITFDDVLDQLDGWSRDGRWLYFSSTSRDIAGMNDVWRVSVDGGTPMPVAADRYANEFWSAPSPDARTVAITARGTVHGQWWRKGHSHLDESEIWLVHTGGADATGAPVYEPVTSGGAKSAWPMWSPDGGTLYFVSDRGGTQNLWSTVRGGAARALTRFTGGRVLWPSISMTGSTIVFERDFGVWRYDVAAGQAAPVAITLRGVPAGAGVEHLTLTNGVQELALSPDGKKIAFVVRGEVFAAPAKDGGDAARVSATPGVEGELAWAPDSRRLAYASDRDGTARLFLYDFVTGSEVPLTDGGGAAGDVTPVWSPDGALLAFVRGGRELRVLEMATRRERLVATATGFGRPPFVARRGVVFSPDARWIAYTASGGPKGFENAYVVPSAGGESRVVSYLPNVFGGSLSWSPDGTYLLLASRQRTERGQLVRVDLVPRTPRFREDQFRGLFTPEVPRSPSQRPSPRPTQPAPRVPPVDSAPVDSAPLERGARAPRPLRAIVFDDIRRRAFVLPVGVDVGSQAISPDGTSVLVTADVAGQVNLYLYPLDASVVEPVARQLTSTPGVKRDAQWSPDSKEVYFVENGRLGVVAVETRQVRPLAVSAELDVDFAQEKRAVLGEAWTYLRDHFYDPAMHGVDWTAVRAEYAPRVEGARTPDEMRRILSLMVGELDASHSGVSGPPAQPPFTGRLGLRFDPAAYERDGRLRITEVVPLGPAALGGDVRAGDELRAVDGQRIGARTNLDSLLAYTVNRRVVLTVARADGGRRDAEREIVVRPVSAGTEKGLLYRAWVEQKRAYVARASGDRLGYVHMFDMGQASLDQLVLDLDAENHAREGVVVDVRNNNGGFVNAYALDVLSRQPYLVMQRRGAAPVPARTQLGQRALELPTVLVTNQHSLSDAEDFTEGYRAMRLGKVVGEPTAGWIIYTSNVGLVDGTTLRIPFIRVTDVSGRDMEMHPRPVDVPVVRPVGESYTGRDTQLDAAVRELLATLAATRAAPGPERR